jgi:hypothetical protein
MREAADTMEPFDDAMASLYAARAGVEKAEAAGWMDKETWFNGSQAVEAGLADGFLPSAEITEEQDKGVKSMAAARRVEAALRRQGMPRNECRSLIGELNGSRAVAGVQPTQAEPLESRDVSGEWTAEALKMLHIFKS